MTILRIDSHIEERSRLVFVFPTHDKDVKRILPFFENVTIKESKSAKLVKYNPIGRSSNSFGYTGADSRKLAITFNMTLPNIQSFVTAGIGSNLGMRRRDKSVENLQKSFFQDFTNQERLGPARSSKYEKQWEEILGKDPTGSGGENNEEYDLLKYKEKVEDSPLLGMDEMKYRIIDAIVYWANLIRSSVLNNAQNPFYGPPIVRLTYGVLYQNIPCVCTSYRISADDKAGYDQRTMLPRVIGVSMDLLEVREGDRGAYKQAVPISRDNLAGWESIVLSDYQSTDPMMSSSDVVPGKPMTSRDDDKPRWR